MRFYKILYVLCLISITANAKQQNSNVDPKTLKTTAVTSTENKILPVSAVYQLELLERSAQLQRALDEFIQLQATGGNAAYKADTLSEVRQALLKLQRYNYKFVDGFDPQNANDSQLKNFLLSKVEKTDRIYQAGPGRVIVDMLRVCMFIVGMGCAAAGDVDMAGDYLDAAGASTRKDRRELLIIAPAPSSQ